MSDKVSAEERVEDLSCSCNACLLDMVQAAEQAGADTADAEIRRLRIRLFNQRQVSVQSHSTSCSIWGDDGKGGTRENFAQPLPCNCGALIRAAKEKP